ncbi:hypothetical protein LWI29_033568 [Acer saccharum]|uniref:Neprosin PEP catalytic domain-containing protein n=1 Tax=Acer saccharum TaxID=4024 RepID=A0AA39SNC8_ACESA|nr:hypothetical protein LWI29_023685 [Acer saccharum]KAK0594005.1 hypothetical protein LWI29_033568 [Acer saccharum]
MGTNSLVGLQDHLKLATEYALNGFTTPPLSSSMGPLLKSTSFVQVHPSERLGQEFGAVSVIDGQQYGTTPMIYKDPNTGNWWLVVENRISIGYWPKELFTHLNDGASFVQYGGWTYNSPDGLSPPMGSGRFASGNLKQSCFFAQIELMNTNNNLVDATEDILQRFVDSDKCYSAKFWGYQGSVLGQSFSFGGPGGQCNAA